MPLKYPTKRIVASSKAEARRIGAVFYEGAPCEFGHGTIYLNVNARCMECQRLLLAEYGRQRRHSAEFVAAGNARQRAWRKANPAKVKAANARFVARNPSKVRKQRRASYLRWFAKNKTAVYAYARQRENAQRRPYAKPYLAEMRRFYQGKPLGHDVDHIVPLKGKTVSGLHVPWNLQYLPKAENNRKRNHFDESVAIAPAFESHARH